MTTQRSERADSGWGSPGGGPAPPLGGAVGQRAPADRPL